MNLFEYENQRFGDDLWTEEAIEELRKHKPPKGTGTALGIEPDMQYQLWQGCWFGGMDWIQ